MIIFVILLILAVLSFFFSASETAIIGLSRIRLRHMLQQGVKRAQSVGRLVAKLDKVITAVLILPGLKKLNLFRKPYKEAKYYQTLAG